MKDLTPTTSRAGRIMRHVFIVAATLGLSSATGLLGIYLWWMLQPVAVPVITEPIPVLNENREIAYGEPIVLELDVLKTEDFRDSSSERFLKCESGNLVTLFSPGASTELPVGEYTVVSDVVELPQKVAVGDVCYHSFEVTFEVNPIRDIMATYDSEPFTVVCRNDNCPQRER